MAMASKPDTLDALLERIALQHLRIETLQTRHSDRLDFHDVGVGSLKDALQAAFEAGQRSAAAGR
jgi:hypothetical protein